MVTPAALAFRAKFPGLDLMLVETQPAEVPLGLRGGRLDVGLTVVGGADPMPDSRTFATEVLLALPLMVGVAAGHRLARRRSVELSALDGERWVMPSASRFPEFRAQTEQLLSAAGVRPREALETTDDVSAAELVAAGAAVGLVLDLPDPRVPGVALVPITPRVERQLVAVVLAGCSRPRSGRSSMSCVRLPRLATIDRIDSRTALIDCGCCAEPIIDEFTPTGGGQMIRTATLAAVILAAAPSHATARTHPARDGASTLRLRAHSRSRRFGRAPVARRPVRSAADREPQVAASGSELRVGGACDGDPLRVTLPPGDDAI